MKTKYEELYVVKCRECKKVFRTDNHLVTLCPSCVKAREQRKEQLGRKPKKKAAKKPLSVAEILRIGNIYFKVKHKYLHYGDIVTLVDRNVDRCVCCGAVVPEGRHVCPQCEKAV
jgi:predicted amidophosphoribosyltransferase